MSIREVVETWFADGVAITAELVAVSLIAIGMLQATFHTLRGMLRRPRVVGWRKAVWSDLGMWLLLGLQFALAADIVRSASSPSWTDIGRLAAIAAVRVFLGYFLERDLRDLAEREQTEPTSPGRQSGALPRNSARA